MYNFKFTPDTSAYASKDKEFILMFIRTNERYINEAFKVKGYMYVSTIYELFGVKWDAENRDNLCRIYREGCPPIKLMLHELSDGYEIYID